ncbi:MAG: Sir2 family NAD-dependent protein deacetylase [Bacteroidota bacterium]
MKKIAVLTGAGISAESGIKTFRDDNGLWEGHDIMEVASPVGWNNNPALVLDFYNKRRRQLKTVQPNAAHFALANLESDFKVNIVTQNVDNLHEKAGSSNVLHLHGELNKVRSVNNEHKIFNWENDLNLGDTDDDGQQLRPHIVWFGEDVPLLPNAALLFQECDIAIVVGTSMQVYPAAGLIDEVSEDCEVHFIDPKPAIESNHRITVYPESASTGVNKAIQNIKKNHL